MKTTPWLLLVAIRRSKLRVKNNVCVCVSPNRQITTADVLIRPELSLGQSAMIDTILRCVFTSYSMLIDTILRCVFTSYSMLSYVGVRSVSSGATERSI